MIAVFRREVKAYFNSMVAYVFGAILLLFTGIGAAKYNISASVANFEYVLSYVSIIFVIIVPILTMRTIAEDKKQKTDQLLYSLPISTTDVVVGKFFALVAVFLLPMVIVLFYPIVFASYGDVYLPTSYGSIVAFAFVGMCLISIGEFISSLTESQGIAAGISVVVSIFLYYCSSIANAVSSTAKGTLIAFIVIFVLLGMVIKFLTKSNISAMITAIVPCAVTAVIYFVKPTLLEGILPKVIEKMSLFERFSTFVNGVFDVTALVYFTSVIAFFLFLTVQSLEKRRYNG